MEEAVVVSYSDALVAAEDALLAANHSQIPTLSRSLAAIELQAYVEWGRIFKS